MSGIVGAYGKSLDNFEQGSLSGSELWLDDIYYLYVHPEERLNISNELRKELELPTITIDELHLSETDYYQLEYVDESY